MADKRSLVVYYDILEQLEDFNDEQVGKIFRAMVEYDKNGTMPNFTGEMKIAFKFIKLSLDKNKEDYLAKCAKNSESARKRWEKDNANGCERIPTDANDADNDTDNDNENDIDNDLKKKKIKKKKNFVPPTFEQVLDYAKSRKREDLAKKFYDYFTVDKDRTWIDSEGKPVLNWKQKFVTWEGRNPVKTSSVKQEPQIDLKYDKNVL